MDSHDEIFQNFCELVFKRRKPAFELEPHYYLFCFTLWVHWRHRPPQLHAGLNACTARILIELFQRNQSSPSKKHQSAYKIAAESLLDIQKWAHQIIEKQNPVPNGDELEVAFEFQNYSATIGWFLAVCDPKAKNARMRPSVNKAVYFAMKTHQASRAQVFREWSVGGDMAPFAAANFEADIFVSPWNEESVEQATEILKSPKKLREYLQLAQFLQRRMIRVLDKVSLEKRKFAAFPDWVPAVEFDLEPWSEEDERLIKSYESKRHI